MITYSELNTQNHHITELSNALNHLLGDRLLCDAEVTCELFFRYVNEVKNHLEITDRSLYADLLAHRDNRVNNVAKRFMGGSNEIKRIFSTYLKRWCRGPGQSTLYVDDHDAFLRETHEMFELVLTRIQDEVEHLYPLVREVTGEQQRVA